MAKILIANNVPEDTVFKMAVNGITAIEKALGKKEMENLLGKFIIKPEGKPTLVPESDKREPMGINSAIKDFS